MSDKLPSLNDLSLEDLRRLAQLASKEVTQREARASFHQLNQACVVIDRTLSERGLDWSQTLGVSRPMIRDRHDVSRLWAGYKGRAPDWLPKSLSVMVQQAVFGPKDLALVEKCYHLVNGTVLDTAATIEKLTAAGLDPQVVQNYVRGRNHA